MKHINAANTEHAWEMINILLGDIHHDSEGSKIAGYDIYEASNARISDLGNRVEITYYDGSEPETFWVDSTESEPEVIYVVEDDAKTEADIWADFLHRYHAEVLDYKGVFTDYEAACQYLAVITARDPSQANWGSVYIETEREKYALINTLKKYGVPFNVSGCGTGYHVSIMTQGQTDINLCNTILGAI